MPKSRSRRATTGLLVPLSLLLPLAASCTITDPTFSGPTASVPTASFATAEGMAEVDVTSGASPSNGTDETVNFVSESTTELPETVAYVPVTNPRATLAQIPEEAGLAGAQTRDRAAAGDEQAAPDAVADVPIPQQKEAPPQATQVASVAQGDAQAPAEQAGATAGEHPVYITATDPNQTPAQQPQARKRSFLSSLFGTTPASASTMLTPDPPASKALVAQQKDPKPIIEMNAPETKRSEVKVASLGGAGAAEPMESLPGVRQTALFEIKRKSGLDDDSDVDLHEEEDYGPVRVATAAGLARLAPNGLITQTDKVDVACLKPSLVRMLKAVERHYNRKIVVTSGYRSPAHNRRARGAKNSLHMYCAAADVQVPGVSKWELANFVRMMPGRGGVGTYCHTESVHIDVGPERDWNWRCRRRKG